MADCVIVIPCYNEAARLDAEALRAFVGAGNPQRFLFVNDGSRDDTLRLLESLRDEDQGRFAVLDLPQNVGKAEAVRRGVLRALEGRPDFVGYWDADLATPLAEIPRFCEILAARPEVRLVLGSRVRLLGRTIRRRVSRHLLGRLFATAASLALRLPVYDTQCGAKLFRVTPELGNVFAEPLRSRWVFDVELLARLLQTWRSTAAASPETAFYEHPLARWEDVAGSKVRLWDFPKSAWELAVIYWCYCRPNRTALQRPQPSDSPEDEPTVAIRRRAA